MIEILKKQSYFGWYLERTDWPAFTIPLTDQCHISYSFSFYFLFPELNHNDGTKTRFWLILLNSNDSQTYIQDSHEVLARVNQSTLIGHSCRVIWQPERACIWDKTPNKIQRYVERQVVIQDLSGWIYYNIRHMMWACYCCYCESAEQCTDSFPYLDLVYIYHKDVK